MKIKLYDKNFTLLTLLINSSTASDFNNLSYKNQVNGVGDASFVVRIDNPKITTATVKHFNKVEILDEDDVVRWVGIIVNKKIDINLITVKCYGLAHILNKRLTGSAEVHNGQANTEATELLTSANSAENTGISEGTLDVTTAVNITFNQTKVLQAIKSIADAVSAQYIVKTDRKLYVQTIVGQDLSASVFFQYEIDKPELANLLQFNVEDDGEAIISKSYGKNNTLTSAQEDAGIKTEFGLLEDFQNFNEASDQTTLDNLTANNNQDSGLSPAIALSPEVADNFEAGDIVKIKLNNGFISINTSYQILEKAVKIANNQKLITIKLNLEVKDFIADFSTERIADVVAQDCGHKRADSERRKVQKSF
jgi:hypothetical protein